MKVLSRPVAGAALAAVLVSTLAAFARDDGAGTGAFEVVERWSVDWRFALRGPRAPSPEIALVVFDDRTAEEAGPLFERRAGWGKVISAAKAAGAKVIGVDAMFDVPERLLGEDLQGRVATWRAARGEAPLEREAEQLLRDISAELDGDVGLATTIREAGNVVLIIFVGDRATSLEPAALGRAKYGQSTPGLVPPVEARAVIGSLPELTAAAKGLGFASVSEDGTHTVRRLLFARSLEGGIYMPFTVPAVALSRGIGRGQLAYLGPQQEVRVGETRFALDDDALWLDFLGRAGTFPTYSAVDLVAGKVPAGALAGKIVLLGVTRLGYDDTRTPFGSLPGVEVQATAIDNLLRGHGLSRVRRTVELGLTLGLGLLAALLFFARRLPVQLVGGLVLLGGWAVAAVVLFSTRSLWVPWVLPTLSLASSLAVGLVLSYASEALQRQQLKKAFGHYVGADVLDELVAHPEKLALGGERRELTVFFSDIRDFTTLSEKLSPVELVSFLNTYLSPMTQAVLKEGGLLDKYIGDAVMAVFGAPVPRADHADLALRCVLQMHRELDALNQGPLQRFGLTVHIGVGVNTGDMVVGNMGSAERFDYTVAGDSVNLASRLEGLSKTYGVFCLVGEGTVRAAKGGFIFRELDLVQVKGKHEAVAVFELLSGPGRAVQTRAELARWQEGLGAFRAGKLPEARAAFTAFAAANPTDVAAQRYLARLAELPEHAPEGFSAVTAFTTK